MRGGRGGKERHVRVRPSGTRLVSFDEASSQVSRYAAYIAIRFLQLRAAKKRGIRQSTTDSTEPRRLNAEKISAILPGYGAFQLATRNVTGRTTIA